MVGKPIAMTLLSLHCVCTLGSNGIWTEGSELRKQALYHLSHTSSPFQSGYFGDEALLFAQISLDLDFCIFWFYVDRITVVQPMFSFLPWGWGLTIFFHGLTWNWSLLISASHIAWITYALLQPAMYWDDISWIFCPNWPSNHNPDSTFQSRVK
jgi:hypothetical protein